MQQAGISLAGMRHVHSRTYHLHCNWKVFCDNYLVRQLKQPSVRYLTLHPNCTFLTANPPSGSFGRHVLQSSV